MKNRYRLIRRGSRSKSYYCVDTQSGKRTSLGKVSADEAKQIVAHKNTAQRQPMLNLQIAKAYLAGTDSGVTTRTWGHALQYLIEMKSGDNRKRWTSVSKDKALKALLPRVLVETQAEEILNCIKTGTVSTNIFLRRIHNFCLDMGWLPWPIMPKRQWPVIRFKEKRAVTREEHNMIIEREHNPERKAYYQMAWHIGASQSDLAKLKAEDIDWENRIISFFRKKTLQPSLIRFGDEIAETLNSLPKKGLLFPMLSKVRHGDREFKQRCDGLGIKGVTLHSYRYAWAERAQSAGYPERFAQNALGHNSKAVHRVYARKAQVLIPPLEDYEKKIIPFNIRSSSNRDSATG